MTASGDNERLADELRDLVERVDPVPEDVTAYAESALAYRRVPARKFAKEVRLEREPVAITRAADTAEHHMFRYRGLTIEVDVEKADVGFVLLGVLDPPSRASVQLQRDEETLLPAVEANDRGQFRLELSDGGRVRLAVVRESQPAVETSWFTV